MTEVRLSPELEDFAKACVANGAFDSVTAVAEAGLRLLREQVRSDLLRSVAAAEVEADRDGWLTADEVEADLRQLLTEIEAERG